MKSHAASWVSQGRQANIPRENGRGMLITEWEFQKSECIRGGREKLRKLIDLETLHIGEDTGKMLQSVSNPVKRFPLWALLS